MKYNERKFKEENYICSYCGKQTYHDWSTYGEIEDIPFLAVTSAFGGGRMTKNRGRIIYRSECKNCNNTEYWEDSVCKTPILNNTLCKDYKEIPLNIINNYEKARRIIPISEEDALISMRRCIEQICKYYNKNKGNLEKKISDLKGNKLSIKQFEACEVIRLYGNNAVHKSKAKNISEVYDCLTYVLDEFEKSLIERKIKKLKNNI